MEKHLAVCLIALIASAGSAAASSSGNALDNLLTSASLAERRVAYLDILNDPSLYFDQITDALKDWKTIKSKSDKALDRLIYLASLLKRDEFVPALASIAVDSAYREYSCVYDCPAELSLAVYSLTKPWHSDGQATDWSLPFIGDVESLLRGLSLSRKKTGIEFARSEDQEALESAEAMSEEDLIQQASPSNPNVRDRWIAAEVLSGMVKTDKNIRELYWLALEEIGGDDFEYRSSIYRAILRAELARANMKKAATEHGAADGI